MPRANAHERHERRFRVAERQVAGAIHLAAPKGAPQARVQGLEFSQSGQTPLVVRGDALAVVATDPDARARLAIELAGSP
jgi:hypothetical protein